MNEKFPIPNEKVSLFEKFKEEYEQIKIVNNIYGDGDYLCTNGYEFNEESFMRNEFEIIDENHNFINFLNGFTHNLVDIVILHGWFCKTTYTAKFIVKDPITVGNLISIAWQKYLKNNKGEITDVHIYSIWCSDLYKSNEYDIDENKFYKDLIKKLVDNII